MNGLYTISPCTLGEAQLFTQQPSSQMQLVYQSLKKVVLQQAAAKKIYTSGPKDHQFWPSIQLYSAA